MHTRLQLRDAPRDSAQSVDVGRGEGGRQGREMRRGGFRETCLSSVTDGARPT